MTALPDMNRAFSLNSALRYLICNYSRLSAPEQGRVLPHPTLTSASGGRHAAA
jgi:hypothetical protein